MTTREPRSDREPDARASFSVGGLARVLGLGILALAIVWLLHWVQFLNVANLDTLLERGLLSLASTTVGRAESDVIRLVYIEEDDNGPLGDYSEETSRQRWRLHHADLLGKLADVGARVVAFDFAFLATVEGQQEATQAFSEALRTVSERTGTRVLLGYSAREDSDALIYDAVPQGAHADTTVAAESAAKKLLTGVLLAAANVEVTGRLEAQRPHRPLPMGLALFLAAQAPRLAEAVPFIDRDARLLRIDHAGREFEPITVDILECTETTLNCPVAADHDVFRRAVLPVWLGSRLGLKERSYASVALQAQLSDDYKDKVVLIGARSNDDQVVVGEETEGGVAWGYQVHGRVLADLLSDTYLRRPRAWAVVATLTVLLVAGVVARLFLPALVFKVPLGPLGSHALPAGLLIAVALDTLFTIQQLRGSYVLHQIGYHWLALVAGYYLVSRSLLRATS